MNDVTTQWDLILMSAIIFVPTLFALVMTLPIFPSKIGELSRDELMRMWTLAGTLVTFVLTTFLFVDYLGMLDTSEKTGHREDTLLSSRMDEDTITPTKADPAKGRDLVARVPWISRFNIDYALGVDGISMALVLLTSALSVLAMLASWNIKTSVRGYCILFLVLETGMLGTFLALDLFLFYIFWEVMLLPMYFLIGIWGGPRREYAAIKFFLYTLLGSVFILIAILGFYFTDLKTMDTHLQSIAEQKRKLADGTPRDSAESREYLTAQRELDVVRAVKGKAERSGQSTVNTFDITLLQKVGRESARIEAEYQQALQKYASALEKTGADAAREQERARKEFEAAEKVRNANSTWTFGGQFQIWMFVLLFIGFAIKVPMFPFHTWLPDAHVEAPTPISMILAGVLLKMGGYGILRIAYPICPWGAYELAWWIGLFGVISIVYGAFAAMAQTDFKKLVAYSSVSHMGYVVLGIAVWTSYERFQYWGWGMNGAMYQMIAHGITSAGMFFLVGVIYDRVHHRDLNRFGGLNNTMPLYSGLSAVIFFGALGLPGLCGFVGEFFTILGTWNYSILFAVLAALTVVITAGYILWTLQRVYLGKNNDPHHHHELPEITLREMTIAVPLVILAVLLGVYPSLVLNWMEPSVTGLVRDLAGIIPR